jgi:hypothetical protein
MTISRVELDVTLAFCDNRFTMHHGIHDYGDDRRLMRRVTLRGERHVGPATPNVCSACHKSLRGSELPFREALGRFRRSPGL